MVVYSRKFFKISENGGLILRIQWAKFYSKLEGVGVGAWL